MKIKTSELTGADLDLVVSMVVENSRKFPIWLDGKPMSYAAHSTDWAHGGQIIEHEKITLEWTGENWCAYIRHDEEEFGITPLIAAMRCYVASKLGDEVEVPEGL